MPSISISGSKPEAIAKAREQAAGAVGEAIVALIESTPGEQVSISGSYAVGEKSSTFTLSGSTWTPTP